MDMVEPMLEQLNNLYNQYVNGVEGHPPVLKRQQIDQLMFTLHMSPKHTQGLRYRADTIYARFVAYRNRWDRLLRDIEAGRVKRKLKTKL